MSKRKITIAVTGLNNIDPPGPGIPAIRALKGSTFFDVRFIGLSYESLELGHYMRDLVEKSYTVPMPSAGSSVLLDRLVYINNKENLDVIIPKFGAERHNFIRLNPSLKQQLNRATFLPTQEQSESRHKSVLYEFGKDNDVKVPFAKMFFSANEINRLKNEFTYPLVIKGKYYDASIAATPTSLAKNCNYHFNVVSKKGMQ